MIKQKNHTMRIGLLLSSAPGYSETFFRSKIKGLTDAGNEVVLFCSENGQNFNLCPIVTLSKQQKNHLKQILGVVWVLFGLIPYSKTVIKFIRLERKDHTSWLRIMKRIYSYAPIFKVELDWLHFGFGTLALGGENLAAAKNAKMAVSFRGFDIGVYPIKYPNCYTKLWEKVSKIHVISNDISDLIYKHGFKDKTPIVKITPAIDTQYFHTSKQSLFEDPIKIVTVARLHWKKGLNYTLEALALLKKSGVSFEYRIIGSGSEEEALKFSVYQLGLQNEVKFMGKLEPNEVKKQMSEAQIYIQYSVQEGFCNAVLEAQAMGLLCVVSDAEGLGENVLDGQTGWVVPKRLPQELAQKIKLVIGLPKIEKQRIIDAATLRVNQQFHIKQQQQAFIRFYTER